MIPDLETRLDPGIERACDLERRHVGAVDVGKGRVAITAQRAVVAGQSASAATVDDTASAQTMPKIPIVRNRIEAVPKLPYGEVLARF